VRGGAWGTHTRGEKDRKRAERESEKGQPLTTDVSLANELPECARYIQAVVRIKLSVTVVLFDSRGDTFNQPDYNFASVAIVFSMTQLCASTGTKPRLFPDLFFRCVLLALLSSCARALARASTCVRTTRVWKPAFLTNHPFLRISFTDHPSKIRFVISRGDDPTHPPPVAPGSFPVMRPELIICVAMSRWSRRERAKCPCKV